MVRLLGLIAAILLSSATAGQLVGTPGGIVEVSPNSEYAPTGPPPSAPASPVELQVSVERVSEDQWLITATGTVHMPAPGATVTLASPDVDLSIQRFLGLEDEEEFSEDFLVEALAGSRLTLDFAYDNVPFYGLRSAHGIMLGERVEVVRLFADEPIDEGVPSPRTLTEPGEHAVLPQPPGPDALTTVTGTVWFVSQYGSNTLCRYCKVSLFDWDAGGDHDFLATVNTQWDGTFSATIDNADPDGGTYGADVFIRVYARDTFAGRGRVMDPNASDYNNVTDVLIYGCPDTSCPLGSIVLNTAGNVARAFWIHRGLMYGWQEIRNGGPNEDILGVVARYPVDDYDPPGDTHDATTAHFHTDPGGEIHMGSATISSDIIEHEHGHYAMYKAYNWGGGDWWFPPNGPQCPVPHEIDENSTSQMCAWSEGWAVYFPLEVWEDAIFTWANGSWINLETWQCSWTCGTATGDYVEGRVAGTLWDLVDSVNDDLDQNIDYSVTNTWTALRYNGGQDLVFHDYYDNWVAAGYSGQDFRNAAATNTIVYS